MFLACHGLLPGVASDAPSEPGVAVQQISHFAFRNSRFSFVICHIGEAR
jgi:hypothetical protein